MIPRRITLKGFLCYRDEQEIDFDGADLWVLSGRNGSGKSAVFDAMTYALFDAHRGGKQYAARLINADSGGFEIVFEFDLGGDRYRIKRGLRRGASSGERLVYRHDPGGGGGGHWRPVPATDSKSGFDDWVRDHLGLTHETFTSSVLLMQGEAEKLLGADNRKRYDVLAGVEDLARYERLGTAADKRRVAAKARAETYRGQARALPQVDEDAVGKAACLASEAESARETASAVLGRLTEIRSHAREWAGLEGQRAEARREADEALALLAGAAEVRRDYDRLIELDNVLPVLTVALDRRTNLLNSEATIGPLESERKRLDRTLDLTDALAADLRGHRAAVAEGADRDESRRHEVVERLTALAVPLDRARRAREGREAAGRIESLLAADPVGHGAEAERLEGEYQRRSDWRTALPTLEAFARDRDGLARSREEAQVSKTLLNDAEAEATGLATASEGLNAEIASAREAAGAARDRVTAAKSVFERAEASLKRFLDLDGATACERCGQELTPFHFAAESSRLRVEEAEARRLADEADLANRAAQSAYREAEVAGRDVALRLEGARDAVKDHRHRLDRAEGDAVRSGDSCVNAYHALAEPFRRRVAGVLPEDWRTTTFPSAVDLNDARRLVEGIGTVTQQRDEARRRLIERQRLSIQRDEARRAAAELGVDEAAAGSLVAEQAALTAGREALDRRLQNHGAAIDLADETLERLGVRSLDFRARLAEIDKDLSAERARAGGLRGELQRSRSGAPDVWRAAVDEVTGADIDAWEAERRSLRGGGIEDRAGELPRAQFRLHAAQARLDELQRRIEAIPEEARVAPSAVESSLTGARAILDAAEATWRAAVGRREQLGRDLQARRAHEVDALAAERDLAVAESLAGMLGWNGLQRHLLREAERSITDCANRFLGVISGGDLELRLAGEGDSERALNLEVKVRTHGRTHVLFPSALSGSQKFRVAVSLALGIGQHARGAGRRVESVIIDEGFGSLDRQGRQEMIAQLGDLQGVLARIILVSHQEEIADAFPDGYRFEIIDGATVARPFHR